MSKPPASGPHSDLSGVNRDARISSPTRDTDKGHAGDVAAADEQSTAQPDRQPPATD